MSVDLYKKAYHFTHVDNLRTIAQYGLLSHTNVDVGGISRCDISDHGVQRKRARREPIHNRRIHDYVPMYLNPRNPMLYRLRCLADHLVMLAIDISDFFPVPALFTDGNAACSATCFGSGLDTAIPSDEILRSECWNGYYEGTRRRCAEFLVPDRIPVSLISSVYARNGRAKAIADALLPIPCAIEPDLYFRP